ncbi:MAG: class I SAM-dependent methyltransferase [Nitrososphaerota archaeon]|jgi:ubiquinone/menaquinone biosynthesis C-methylase UbiE|nr:class I SAM-dependent methyltransferase [Nitrososphaerota archaeon]
MSNTLNFWEQAAKNYETYYDTQYKRADILEKQLITKLLGQIPEAQSILEVGCGTAHFTKWLQTKGYECYGIDCSGAMLREAKKLWSRSSLFGGEGCNLPFQNKSIDIVIFITSLEFISEPDLALDEAIRVARKGLIVGLLNKHSSAHLKVLFKITKGSPLCFGTFYSFSDFKKTLPETHKVVFWSTTVFPKIFGNLESRVFPFGDFLGIAIKNHENQGQVH